MQPSYQNPAIIFGDIANVQVLNHFASYEICRLFVILIRLEVTEFETLIYKRFYSRYCINLL